MRLADDAHERAGISPRMVVIVDPVTDAETIEPRAQIEKNSLMPADRRLAAENAANDPPRKPVERQPAVFIRLLIEQIQHENGFCAAQSSGRVRNQISPGSREGGRNPNCRAKRPNSASAKSW